MQSLPLALFHPFAPDHLSAQDGKSFSVHVHTETLLMLLMSAVDINKVAALITQINFEFGAAFSHAVGPGDLQSPFPPKLSWAALLGAACGIPIAWLSCLRLVGKEIPLQGESKHEII